MSLLTINNQYIGKLPNTTITINDIKSIYSDRYNVNEYTYLTQANALYYKTTLVSNNVDKILYFEYFPFSDINTGLLIIYYDIDKTIQYYKYGNNSSSELILNSIILNISDILVSHPSKTVSQIEVRYFNSLPSEERIHIFILFTDGTCVTNQSNYPINQITTWNNIIKLLVPYDPNGFTCGLTNTNTLLITNYTNTLFEALSNVSTLSNVKDIQFDTNTSIYLLTYDNTISYFGNNEFQQSDCEAFTNISQIKLSTNTVYGLTYDGNIRSLGEHMYTESNANIISLDTYTKYAKYLFLFKEISNNHIITFNPDYIDLTSLYNITQPDIETFLKYGLESTTGIDYTLLNEFTLLISTYLPDASFDLTLYALEQSSELSILSLNIPMSMVLSIKALVINHSMPENTDIRVLLSFDNQQTWQYYNGTEFISTSLDDINTIGNTISEIQSLFTNYILEDEWQSLDILISLISYDLYNVPTVTSVGISYILDSLLRILLSNDKGTTWYGYYNNQIIPVDINNDKAIYKYGFDMNTLNTAHNSNPNIWNEFITPDNVIRFLFYLSENEQSDILELDILSMQVDIAGTWKLLNDSDYDYSFPLNNILRVTIYTDGSYKINYNVIDYTPPNDLKSFTLSNVTAGIELTWTPPDDYDYLGVIIRKSDSAFPTNLSMGEFVYQGSGTTYTDTNVIAGTIYYYTAFPYDNRMPMNVNLNASTNNRVSIEYY